MPGEGQQFLRAAGVGESSAGSRPKRRTNRFAVLFKWLVKGPKAVVKPRCGVVTTLATAGGREIAQFLGTSSPTTISTTVDTATPGTVAIVEAAALRPIAVSGPRSSAAGDGSAACRSPARSP